MLFPQHLRQLPASQAKAIDGHCNPQHIHLQNPWVGSNRSWSARLVLYVSER